MCVCVCVCVCMCVCVRFLNAESSENFRFSMDDSKKRFFALWENVAEDVRILDALMILTSSLMTWV